MMDLEAGVSFQYVSALNYSNVVRTISHDGLAVMSELFMMQNRRYRTEVAPNNMTFQVNLNQRILCKILWRMT